MFILLQLNIYISHNIYNSPNGLPDFNCGMITFENFKNGLHDFSIEVHIDLHGGTAPNISTNSGAKIAHACALIRFEQPILSSKENARNMAFFLVWLLFFSKKKLYPDAYSYPRPLQNSRSSGLL